MLHKVQNSVVDLICIYDDETTLPVQFSEMSFGAASLFCSGMSNQQVPFVDWPNKNPMLMVAVRHTTCK